MKAVLILFLFVTVLFSGCTERKNLENEAVTDVFNRELADELKSMAVIDQIAAYIRQGEYVEWGDEKWNNFKDSVFRTHKMRLEEIFNEVGYPGFDLVGKEGAKNFWLMTQHSDFDPEFQRTVLENMKIEVQNNNAEGSLLGLLTDRVNLNSGAKQIYGTQVQYNVYGQAYPKPLEDSVNVNQRRSEVGLDPLEVYLNRMTQSHFEMNKEYLKSKGITEPKLYKIYN